MVTHHSGVGAVGRIVTSREKRNTGKKERGKHLILCSLSSSISSPSR